MTGFRERIDTNKNNRIDINSQRNEINNFILDKNKGEENLNELGKYLNDLDPLKLDNLGIKDALQSYFTTPERTKLDQGIKNKVNKNEPLTKKELNLLYLEVISEGNNQIGFQKQKFDSQQLKFDSNKPIDQICNGALIGFIRTKYNFPTYTGKKVKIDLPNKPQKKTNNPIDKIQENKGGNIILPENIGEIKESEADFYCNRLITWAEQNFPNEIDKAKRQLQIRYKYKDKPVEQAYIKYETLLIAFNKYCEIVSKNHTKLITSPEIGYKDDEEFKRQMNQIEYFESEISKRYPGIDKILEIVKKFYEEVDQNKKKFFGEDKDGIKLKKAENDYKHFNEFIKNKYKEYDIKKTEEALKKTPNSGDEAVEYFLNYNKIAEFQNEINKKKSSYGDSIRKYTSYTKNLQSIHEKYNLEQYKDTLSKYNYDVQRLSHGIDFGKFQKYTNKIKYETSLQNGMKNVSLLGNLLMDKTNIYFPFKEIRDDEIQKQIKQEETDKWRDDLKNNNPRIHWLLTSLSGLYNGIIDFTIGSASSLGVLILGLIGGKDETLAQMDHKEEFDNRFKVNTSSSQTEEVYNSETGEFNFNLDNTTYTVASSISQMLGLIYGGGAIAKGASKAFQIGENVAGKIGLFSSSFITQIGGSYQEAVKGGLSGGEALGYSMLSATMQSGLELISPNEVLLGKGSGITKELIRNACKSGSKESFKMIGKIFTKNVWNEIREENIQEALQTVAGNLVNMTTNGAFGSELGADWSWKNFAATAVITTLTTGITTGTSTGRQMAQLNNSDKSKLIEYIKNNNGTYSDVMEMIDDGIAGTIKIPNVNIQQLQELKGLLTNQKAEATWKTNTGNIDENYIIELPKEAEKFTEILGSRLHEERRQSRLQSDGTYAPRVEKTSDQTWISQRNGQTEVDIANTPFEDLPSDWKSENLEAAKVAVGLVYDMVKKGEKVTSEMIEKMAEIVHNKRLERNGIEGSFENQRVPYKQLSESEKEKDRNQLLRAIETVKQGNTDYFDGKPHKIFEGNTGNAESNSKLSDRILNEINEENKSEKLEELRKEIIEQYKQTTGEELQLSDEQLLSILDAHEQDGELGKLKLGELKIKVKILSEAITDPKVRRFLLEAGFCGKIEYTGNIDKMKELTDSSNELLNEINTIENYTLEIDKIYEVFRKEIYSLDRTNLDYNKVNDIIQKYNDINGKYDLIIDSLQKVCNKTTIRWQFKSLRDSIKEGNYNITNSELTNLKNLEDYCYRLIEIKSNNLQQWTNRSNSGIKTMLSNLKTLANIDLLNGNNEVEEKTKRCDNLLYTIKRNAEYTKNDLHETYYDARQIQWKREHEQHKQEENDEIQTNKSNYFDGKPHQFEVTEQQARSNSENMDRILSEYNEQNSSAKLEELRNQITEQYKQSTGEELQLSDEQLLSIIDAHEQDGILGELTLGQLRKKVKILDEAITDPKVRRFLLEAGFCGNQIDSPESMDDNKINEELYNEWKETLLKNFPEEYKYLISDFLIKSIIKVVDYESPKKLELDKNAFIEIAKFIDHNIKFIKGYLNTEELDYNKLGDFILAEHLEKNIETLENLGFLIKTIDDLLKLKDIITYNNNKTVKANIETLTHAGINSADDLLKLKDIITHYNTERVKANIEALTHAGIKSADDLVKLEDIITSYRDSEIIKRNIETLNEIGIKTADDLVKLKIIITSYRDSEIIKRNIETLNEIGIKTADDLVKLEDIITSFSNSETIKENIETLNKIGIESADDLAKLKIIITSDFNSETIKENIEILNGIGIKSADDLLKLKDIITSYRDTETIKSHIETLNKIGIKSADDLLKLKDIITSYGDTERVKINIETLNGIGIKSADDLLKLKDIITSYRDTETIKSHIETLNKIGIKSADDLLKLKDIITSSGDSETIKTNIKTLNGIGIKSADDLLKLKDIITNHNTERVKINIETLNEIGIKSAKDLSELQRTIINSTTDTIKNNINFIFKYFSKDLLELKKYINLLKLNYTLSNNIKFGEQNHLGYLKYIDEIISYDFNDEKKCKMIEKICSLQYDKVQNYLEVFRMFDKSISTDIQRIKNELIDEILNSENPEINTEIIINIFERNNLPLTGKIYKVFEILYPKGKFEETLQKHGSPILHQYLQEGKDVYGLIYTDLMNIAIKSGDRSLREYLEIFKGTENILKKFENLVQEEGFNPKNEQCLNGLSTKEKEQIFFLFKKISVLYSRYFGKELNEGDLKISDKQLVKFYNEIKKGFNLRDGKSIYDRLQALLYINGLKYHSVEEVLQEMESSKKQAHERGLKLVNESEGGKIIFPDHAFLKGVDENAFSQIINRGITSREYLGGGEDGKAAGSDATPFDIDGWYTNTFKSGGYGNINLVINTDKDCIYNSREEGTDQDTKGKYELFKTGALGEDHYGIRTGIPMTEVDYIIYTGDFGLKEFQDICYEIAKNGYYIPITDKDGIIKFTPEMYHKMRQGFNYMNEYSGFDIDENKGTYTVEEQDNQINKGKNDPELQTLIDENSPENPKYKEFAEENNRLARESLQKIKDILTQECGIIFNSEFDSSITGAEIYDSGSTGRGTDIPTKDVDLDFTLLLDAKDYERVEEITKIIHEKIGTQKNDDHSIQEGGNQIKSKINDLGKSKERPNGIPLDLLILKKSQVIEYSSSDAMKEKLEIISKNPNSGTEDLNRVKTNIIIMKKLLKAMGCYKKPEGGMSGIGVENWILQNHGSFIEALESFEQVAYGGKYKEGKVSISLKEFQDAYPIYDAGQNYKDGGNDNFVYKLNENGYNGTLKIIQTYRIEGIEGIKKLIKQYEDKKSDFISGESNQSEYNDTDYRNGESHDEGLIFDSEYVTQKDDGIYRFNTKETTNTQKNKPGYQSLQEAEQSLNNQIGGKYDKKLYQKSFTKEHKNENFEEDVDDFIKYATEKELNHKQIFLDLAKEASAKALFIGRPKKKDRIIEKVRNELLKEGEGLEALTDFTRATILFDNFSDFEEGLKVLEQMKNEGRILDLKIRNRLTRPGCNDIFVNIQTPDGYVSEVQFHIPEVLVFRDEKLGDLSIDRYKSDDNILDKHTLTKDIFDLSNDKYKRNLEAYNKIIDRLNEGRDKDHLLSLPKEQNQIVYDHDMYDIIRVLELYENADNLTLEDYELFTSKGFKHENIKDLLNDLRLMKEHLCNEALNRYRKRTK